MHTPTASTKLRWIALVVDSYRVHILQKVDCKTEETLLPSSEPVEVMIMGA